MKLLGLFVALALLVAAPKASAFPDEVYQKFGQAKGTDTSGFFGPIGAVIDAPFELYVSQSLSHEGDALGVNVSFNILGQQYHISAINGYVDQTMNPRVIAAVGASNDLVINNTNESLFGNINVEMFNDSSGTRLNLYSPIGSVPEPGTWLLMIVGVGVIGVALRARRERVGALAPA